MKLIDWIIKIARKFCFYIGMSFIYIYCTVCEQLDELTGGYQGEPPRSNQEEIKQMLREFSTFGMILGAFLLICIGVFIR